MLKVSLTHDVDRIRKTYQYFTHGVRSLSNGDLKDAFYQIISIKNRNKVYWNFDSIIEIENLYNVKSTFFFLDESIPLKILSLKNWKLALGRYDLMEPKVKSIIEYLSTNGWEIGLHGSYLSFNNIELLRREKRKLEAITNQETIGIRQHYLNRNDVTWKFQKELGFKYDSTWGFTRDIGFKQNKYKPFRPFNDYFLVFPMVIMDAAYMMESELNREKKVNELINECIENNSILVINWHSNNYDEKEFPEYKKAYRDIIETCLKYRGRFDTLKNFYNEMN